MARAKSTTAPPAPQDEPSAYTVVARRYRPQRFEDVVGQDHVVQALRNAIRLNKLAHAYLFCGTRGVGKTSIARIFAKCLNCQHGPTENPDQTCDICQAIAVGQDVDVIEIDGASNNGVDAVRELRQNAGLRPSRARFKIYYIDEVHMLSTGAFNALLKTLEEPPPHVKFLFATTEPNKIPITVLSRCQRYDFAGITPEQIVESLEEICKRERVEAETDALRTIARRAGGSMRDAQSLLEQLLASGGERLTVELVHRLLGTASDERILDLVDALADHDTASALGQVEQAACAGVQPVDLLNGVIDFVRDLMVLAAGAEGALLSATPRQRPRLQAVVDRWPIDTILAALQILAEYRGRLRGSPHGRTLVELALAKVARLENLGELGELIGRLAALESGNVVPAGTSSSAVKKKLVSPSAPSAPAVGSPPPIVKKPANGAPEVEPAKPAPVLPPLRLSDVEEIWGQLIKRVGVVVGGRLAKIAPTAVEEPNFLVFTLPAGYNWIADECESPEARAKIEHSLNDLLHRPVVVRFERSADGATEVSPAPSSSTRRRDELEGDPMIQKLVELFDARPIHLEVDDGGSPPSDR